MSVKDNLKKALHKAILKAYQNGRTSKTTDAIVSDIVDPNSQAQVPSKAIPAASEGVLNKDVTLSELHQQKQANAMAKLGQPPTMGQAPKAGNAPKPLKAFMQKMEAKKNGNGCDEMKPGDRKQVIDK